MDLKAAANLGKLTSLAFERNSEVALKKGAKSVTRVTMDP